MSASKVLLVCQWYAPEPVSQPGWLVDGLRREGMDVEVLTGVPNYPDGVVVAPYRAWRTSTETINGVRIRRAPLYPSHDGSVLRRMLNYLSWAIAASVVGLGALRRADAVLVYSSPATAALPAWLGRKFFGVRYVLLVQDVWPDSVFASGFLNNRLQRAVEFVIGRFVRATYKAAESVVVTAPGMLELLVSRGVPVEKVSLVYNWVDESPASEPSGSLRSSLAIPQDDVVVLYAGNHGAAQALDSAVRAFAAADTEPAAHLVLVGDGIERQALQSLAAGLGTNRVHFVDTMPRHELMATTVDVDAHLVSLADRPLFSATVPSKLQAALAAGVPVLVAANGDPATLVEAAGAGAAAPAENPGALTNAIHRLVMAGAGGREQMGRRASELYTESMSAAIGARRLADILRQRGVIEGETIR